VLPPYNNKKLPIRAYFFILCSLVFLALAIDTATVFLSGGPVLRGARMDLAWERLDFEEDAKTMMKCCSKTTKTTPLNMQKKWARTQAKFQIT
jgi:hypothetical protein